MEKKKKLEIFKFLRKSAESQGRKIVPSMESQ